MPAERWPQQVLSNAELRERYDKHGEQALDVDFMDSAEFFAMLFGSDRCESYAARYNAALKPLKLTMTAHLPHTHAAVLQQSEVCGECRGSPRPAGYVCDPP